MTERQLAADCSSPELCNARGIHQPECPLSRRVSIIFESPPCKAFSAASAHRDIAEGALASLRSAHAQTSSIANGELTITLHYGDIPAFNTAKDSIYAYRRAHRE